MSDVIFEIEHHPGEELVLRFKSPKFRMLSESTREHLSAAKKEVLLALRSMLDREIEKEEKAGETGGKTEPGFQFNRKAGILCSFYPHSGLPPGSLL